MAQVDKIKVGDTTYDISASPDATTQFNSADTTTDQANMWTETAPITSNDTNSTILNKTSSMFKNVRYLYNSLGSGVSPSNTVASQLDGKAPKVHSHSINDIPHSDIVENTTTTVPTSAVVYKINKAYNKLNGSILSTEDINTVKQNMLSSASIMKGTVKGTIPVVKSSIIEVEYGKEYNIPKGYHDGKGIIKIVMPSTVRLIAEKYVISQYHEIDTSHGGDFHSAAYTAPAIDITKYKYCTITGGSSGGHDGGGCTGRYASVTAASGRIDRFDLGKRVSVAHLTGNATFYVHSDWHNSWAAPYGNHVWVSEVLLES